MSLDRIVACCYNDLADCSWLPEQHKRKLVADRIDEVITDYYGSWIYSINLYSAYM